MRTSLLLSLVALTQFASIQSAEQQASFLKADPTVGRSRWTVKQANAWFQSTLGWRAGVNFIPSTAVNTLEMWQAETYDRETINRELGLVKSLGMQVIRVFLHHKVWAQDQKGFMARLEDFLTMASRNDVSVILVMFDDCWNAEANLGKQPDPIPGVHNSQWVRSPGEKETDDENQFGLFEQYFSSVIGHYKWDPRIYMWDIYNEPGNNGFEARSLPLLKAAFKWAQAQDPDQAITAGVWNLKGAPNTEHINYNLKPNSNALEASNGGGFKELIELQLSQSDIITFHVYADIPGTTNFVNYITEHAEGRLIMCTEYMARTINSQFSTHIPLFREQNIVAINWGLVSGKTNTIYPWGSPAGAPEPKIWFHDIFRKDGTPFDEDEVYTIRVYTEWINKTLSIE
eukprot:403351829